MTSLSTPGSPADGQTSTDISDDADEVAGPSVPTVAAGLVGYGRAYLRRVRGGEMGSLPAATGLIILVILFTLVQNTFASLYNFGNLLTEGAGPILLAMGLVFVLLLGEIDLSAGYAAGVCAAVMVRLTSGYGYAWPISIGAAILTGVVIGFVIGWLRAKVRIPSFVVTLAFFLAFQGVMLYIVNNGKGQHGDIGMTDTVALAFENSQMPVWMGWTFGIVFVAGYAGAKALGRLARKRQNLSAEPITVIAVKVTALALGVLLAVYELNQNRALHTKPILTNVDGKLQFVKPPAVQGVPWVVLVIAGFFVLWTFILSRTRYGRHIYAVGGNEEAARRAGIGVDRIRISVFVICSGMAAVGGIMIGSNVSSVSVANYGGNTLLLAVGAAVIGGTSLFGGKGKMIDALVGGAVVEVIQNGMSDLVKGTNSSAVQYVITGLVLLLAAAVDALSRRRASASGLS